MIYIESRFGGEGVARFNSTWLSFQLVATFIGGLFLSVIGFQADYQFERNREQTEFQRVAESLVASFKREIDTNLEVLHAIESFYRGGAAVSRSEFTRFVGNAIARHPNIQALEWIPRISHEERESYEKAARREGLEGFQFREKNPQGEMVEAGEREVYYPVYFVEPLGGNRKALGFDLGSNPIRLQALNQARDSGEMTATARISLVQETASQAGFLVFLPIYSAPSATLVERQRNLRGFGLAVYRVDEMVKTFQREVDTGAYQPEIQLHDVTATEPAPLFPGATSSSRESWKNAARDEGLLHRETLSIAGRRWAVEIFPPPSYFDRRDAPWTPWAFLAAGLAITFLLATRIRHRHELERSNVLLQKNQGVLTKAQSIAHIGNWDWDISAKTLSWSDEIYRIFGLKAQSFGATYDAFLNAVHPDDREKVTRAVQASLEDDSVPYDIEHRVVRPDGSERTVQEKGEITRNDAGEPVRMIGTVHDISELRSTEYRLGLIQQVLELTDEGIFISDAQGRIVSVNSALCKLYGYPPEEIIGKDPSLFKSDRQERDFFSHMWTQLLREGAWRGEIWNRRKNGEVFPIKAIIQAVRDGAGEVSHFVSVHNDLTAIKQRDEELVYSNTHDALTGLPNRGLFLDRLGQALRHAQRETSLVGVSVLNIDLFKKVNDSLGHAHGDDLLTMIARRLEESVRGEDTVCRLGGDEFSIIHPDAENAESIAQVVQRVFGALGKPFHLAQQELRLTASVGISIFPEDGDNAHGLLKNADLAMTRAKEVGRSNFQYFTKTLDERAVQRLTLENDLREGLRKGEFLLHYQPKVDPQTGMITGAESLVRWQRQGGGLVSPGEFIPVAEESGLIVPLGDWILREACFQNAQWQSLNPHLRMAVNLSARQLREPKLLLRLDAALRDSGMDPEKLELEITESMLMDDVEGTVAILQQFKDRGVTIAMDDFGTGYSSLSVLKRFPIDTLKIDQSFVRDLAADSDDAQIVSAIISMARSLNLKVVAEGVETEDQLAFLKEKECDLIQGYLCSKPLSDADFVQALETGRGRGLCGKKESA